MKNKLKSGSNIPDLDYGNLMKLKQDGGWITYKQMCECLNIPYLTSNSKVKQLNELKAICEIEKEGTKYRITEVHPKKTIIKKFNVKCENRQKSGIYKIYNKQYIYIGQTNNFLHRYSSHMYKNKNSIPRKILMNDGYFEIIEFEDDLEKRIEREKQYIKKYSHDKYLICLNKNFNDNTYIQHKTTQYKAKPKIIVHKPKLCNPKPKPKPKSSTKIKIYKEDFDTVIKLLKEHGIEVLI